MAPAQLQVQLMTDAALSVHCRKTRSPCYPSIASRVNGKLLLAQVPCWNFSQTTCEMRRTCQLWTYAHEGQRYYSPALHWKYLVVYELHAFC